MWARWPSSTLDGDADGGGGGDVSAGEVGGDGDIQGDYCKKSE